MEATVHSEAAVVGAREASPAAIRPEVSPVAAPLEAFPAVAPLEVAFPVVVLPEVFQAAPSQAAVVVEAAKGVAEAVDKLWLIKSTQRGSPGPLFFILSCNPVVDRHG
jgi:hypothetical protein